MKDIKSAVEVIADTLRSKEVLIDQVLVPEGCMLVWINGHAYNVTVEKVEFR